MPPSLRDWVAEDHLVWTVLAAVAEMDLSALLDEPVQRVPYIFIAPDDPSAIGEIARRVYRKHYGRPWNARCPRPVAAGKDPRRRCRRDARRASELRVLRRRIRRRADPVRPSRRATLDPRAPAGPLAARSPTRAGTQPPTATQAPPALGTDHEYVRSRPRGSSPPSLCTSKEQPGRLSNGARPATRASRRVPPAVVSSSERPGCRSGWRLVGNSVRPVSDAAGACESCDRLASGFIKFAGRLT